MIIFGNIAAERAAAHSCSLGAIFSAGAIRFTESRYAAAAMSGRLYRASSRAPASYHSRAARAADGRASLLIICWRHLRAPRHARSHIMIRGWHAREVRADS